jgi:Tfp pilus assembly protein FimT
MAMRRRKRARERGLSLIDLLTGIAIGALLLGLAVPNFRVIGRPWRMDAGVRQVAAEIGAARMRSISRNQRHRIRFPTTANPTQAQNAYVIERETSPGTFVEERGLQTLPSGMEFGTIATNPVFDTRGMLGATVTIPIVQQGGSSKTVTVNVLGQTTIS